MITIIPAAGKGERLVPLTDIAPKPLLPVYNKPMIFYPLLLLKEAGLKDIVIVANEESKEQFEGFFKDGKEFGLKIRYAIQKEHKGIAHAVNVAKPIAQGQKIAVILSDNIFEDNLSSFVTNFASQSFKIDGKEVTGASIIVKEVPDPERFGTIELKGDKIVGIEEKPEKPKSNLVVPGFYLFDERVFDVIKMLKPSARGEYEISDVVKFYINEGTTTYAKLKGDWFDVGTIDAMQKASDFIAENKRLREWQFDYE